MKLVAILRIKDQILTIEDCLEGLSKLVDQIVIVDNGSSDGTQGVYKKFPKIVQVFFTEEFDEGRDKIMILDEAKRLSADWIIWLDGDEIFERHVTRNILDRYMSSSYNKIAFRFCHFWGDKLHCRVDGKYFLYSLIPQIRMWRNQEGSYFLNKKIHNGDIQGIEGKPYYSPYRIKHYGYIDKDKMLEKYNLYTVVDKGSKRTYAHIHPGVSVKTYLYREYESIFINRIFIFSWKYFLNIVWYTARVFIKFRKIVCDK